MLGQAYTVVGFLKIICDTPKSEFTVSLKRKSVWFFRGKGVFPNRLKYSCLSYFLNLVQLGKTASLCGLNFVLNCGKSEH